MSCMVWPADASYDLDLFAVDAAAIVAILHYTQAGAVQSELFHEFEDWQAESMRNADRPQDAIRGM